MPAYDAHWFAPPAPLAHVTLRAPDSGATQTDVPMLLDTCADITLIPRAVLNQLGVNINTEHQYELTSFDGSTSIAPVVRLEMLFLGRTFRGQFLITEQEWGIIGRNILNALPLLFDGPHLHWEQSSAPA
jgi:Aspartyl protease